MARCSLTLRWVFGLVSGLATEAVAAHTSPAPVPSEIQAEETYGNPAALHRARSSPPSGLMTISLRCPNENGGVLEVIRKNAAGFCSRSRVYFRSGQAIKTISDTKKPGQPYVSDVGDTSPETRRGQRVHDKLCTGNEVYEERASKFLRESRDKLRNAGGNPDVGDCDI